MGEDTTYERRTTSTSIFSRVAQAGLLINQCHPLPSGTLSRPPDHAQHASGVAAGATVGEEQLAMAACAAADHADRARPQSRIEKLPPVGLRNIEVQPRPDRRVSRRALRQKQHGILLP